MYKVYGKVWKLKYFQSHKSKVKKKMEFDIFVTTVSLCPTCNPIPLEIFKYQKEETMIISGTRETKSLLTTKPMCHPEVTSGLQHSEYPHHAVSSEFPEDKSVYTSMTTIKCQFMWYKGDT